MLYVYIKSLSPKGWLASVFICIRVCKISMVCLFYAAKCSRDILSVDDCSHSLAHL